MKSRTHRYGSAQVGGLGGLCLPAIVVELGQFLQLEFFGVYHFFWGEFALLELWYILFGTILLFFCRPLGARGFENYSIFHFWGGCLERLVAVMQDAKLFWMEGLGCGETYNASTGQPLGN